MIHQGFATTGLASCDPPTPPLPPLPLSVSISAAPPENTASPVGGFPPYTYLWEACAIDCTGGGGDAAAPAFRAVRPYLVAHGWHFLSTAVQVYWNPSQWNLRVTVTDSQNGQAQAQYFVP